MIDCYHGNVTFTDPVFRDLSYAEAAAMWRMLCQRGKDLRIEYRDVEADDRRGSADWEATYTFSQTGLPVRNRIHSAFEFRDGLIVAQRDHFDLWRWSRMALGMKGLLLGWNPLVKNAIRRNAKKALAAHESQRVTTNPR